MVLDGECASGGWEGVWDVDCFRGFQEGRDSEAGPGRSLTNSMRTPETVFRGVKVGKWHEED